MSKNQIVKRIQESLETKNITAYEIAKNTKLSEVAINRIKRGEVKNPNDNTINILSEYLETHYGINKVWLTTGQGIEQLPTLPAMEQLQKMASGEKEKKLNQIATFIIKNETDMMENALFKSFIEKLAYRIVIDTMNQKNAKKED